MIDQVINLREELLWALNENTMAVFGDHSAVPTVSTKFGRNIERQRPNIFSNIPGFSKVFVAQQSSAVHGSNHQHRDTGSVSLQNSCWTRG